MSQLSPRRWRHRHGAALTLSLTAVSCALASGGETASIAGAAESAALYWRGGRVRAAEEPYRAAPLIGPKGEMDYGGDEGVRECMEYYLDKFYEENLRARLTHLEMRAARLGAEEAVREQRPPARGLVTYLLMENSQRTQHKDLLLSLHCLHRFFWNYPVAIFHTNASSPAELRKLREESPTGQSLIFELVHLDFPFEVANAPGGPDGFLAPPRCVMDGRHWWSSNQSCGCRCPAWRPQCWPLNWMHATRFFTAGMFRTRIFRSGQFDYFLRMDTDLFFAERPVVDPFVLMASRGCAMVYDKLSRETPGCFDGFDDKTIDFMENFDYRGKPDTDILHVARGPAAAGGQWTIGDARLFGSEAYLRLADFFASGIYSHRWADQLFLVRGLALFGPRSAYASSDAPPEVSICVRSLFEVGREDLGFVHKKGGYYDRALVETCGAPEAAFH